MALAAWASSDASTNGSSSYDVFLNFRGEDTRHNFIGFLHKALKDKGINVFLDSKSLWIGDAIGQALCRAIHGSKISIPVFSRGYADSKWCLRELYQIAYRHKYHSQSVLPIFFYIDPSHVRNQTGSFEEAFCKHEREFNAEIVWSWRDALEWVGNLKGVVLNETTDQAEQVEIIVKRVLGELVSVARLAECKYPIRMESSIYELLSLLSIGSNDVQFVGICGFGGIGKTTIAKAVYNRIFLDFNKHCFLSDVREQASQCMGLVSLQKLLLKDIFKIDADIANCHLGKTWIEQRLSKEKVLLVLDDVDSEEQVDALAGGFNWFGQGSRVIITTRDEHILNVARVDKEKIFCPQELNREESLQLFSLHAFSKGQPPEDYLKVSQDVACYSGGLPLTLEVLGSYLSNMSSKQVWESTLQILKEIPHQKVQRRLRISYDNLENDYQKAIFLDVACFFIGWEKDTVISIWKACGYYPESAIHRLIKRSLLKFEGNIFKMHDQIRDMGREIVSQESFMEPGKRSRLWSRHEILEVLEQHRGTDMIKGMSLHNASPGVNVASQPFGMMSNLRFLDISSANFMGDFSHLPSALKCFIWMSCPWKILPTNFYHENLLYLNLSDSSIRQPWCSKPQDENKRFQKLKVLDLSRCRNLSEFPDFSWFPYLERLDLGHCYLLEKLDESIGQLSQLKSLILENCYLLGTLPESIGDLKSLVELHMGFSRVVKLPNSVGQLEKLEVLDASNCPLLLQLPDLSRLKNLSTLELKNCTKLERIQGLEGTESLKKLDARGCSSLTDAPRKVILSPFSPRRRVLSDQVYDNNGFTLCFAFTVISDQKFIRLRNSTKLDISASIRQKDKRITCHHSVPLTIESVCWNYTGDDIFYVHHFKGFDWFGIPLEGIDAIEILHIYYFKRLVRSYHKAELRILLIDNREPGLQNPKRQLGEVMVVDLFDTAMMGDELMKYGEKVGRRTEEDGWQTPPIPSIQFTRKYSKKKMPIDSLEFTIADEEMMRVTMSDNVIDSIKMMTVDPDMDFSNSIVAPVLVIIWESMVQPRVKNFLWEACLDAMGVQPDSLCELSDSTCPICKVEPETMEHALFYCIQARQLWFASSLTLRIPTTGTHQLMDWILKWASTPMLTEHEYKSQLAAYFTTLWELWKIRNACVSGNNVLPFSSMVATINAAIHECLDQLQASPSSYRIHEKKTQIQKRF